MTGEIRTGIYVVFPIWEELCPPVTRLKPGRIQFGQLGWLSSGRGYPIEPREHVRREHDDAILIPCSASSIRGLANHLHRLSADVRPFQFSLRQKIRLTAHPASREDITLLSVSPHFPLCF